MKFLSSIRFDSLIMPIFFIFFYDHRSASGSISGPEIAHPAICTGASGDLYWRQYRSPDAPVQITGCAISGPEMLPEALRWS